MSKFILHFNVYSGDVDPRDTAPELEVITKLHRGRKVVPFPQWFDVPSGSVIYITCSFIRFETTDDNVYYLVWPYNTDAQIKAYWDELKNEVTISYSKGVREIALYCWDRQTLIKTWRISPAINVKPKQRIWHTTCPRNPTVCVPIPELPRLGSSDEHALLSTKMFDVCVDIPGLPMLV
jgi:hypothetical protein